MDESVAHGMGAREVCLVSQYSREQIPTDELRGQNLKVELLRNGLMLHTMIHEMSEAGVVSQAYVSTFPNVLCTSAMMFDVGGFLI